MTKKVNRVWSNIEEAHIFFILKGIPPMMPCNMIDGVSHHIDLEEHCDPEFKDSASAVGMINRFNKTFG